MSYAALAECHSQPKIRLGRIYRHADMERIPNGHSFYILHMEGIAGELKSAGIITQNEMKSCEGYSKWKEVYHWISKKWLVKSIFVPHPNPNPNCSTSLLWQSIVGFGIMLWGTTSTSVCQSPKFLVASICDLPEVINCQFLEFAVAASGPMHFLLPDQ